VYESIEELCAPAIDPLFSFRRLFSKIGKDIPFFPLILRISVFFVFIIQVLIIKKRQKILKIKIKNCIKQTANIKCRNKFKIFLAVFCKKLLTQNAPN